MKAISILKRAVLLFTCLLLMIGFLALLAQAVAPAKKFKPILIEKFVTDRDSSSERITEYVPGEILVKFKKGISPREIENFAAAFPAKVKKHYKAISRVNGYEYVLLKSEAGAVPQMLHTLRKDPYVVFAEPNYKVHTCTELPNDPRFNEAWGLHNTGQTGGTPDVDIDAPETWERIDGARTVIVAVIDTGIDYTHPDLAADMWVNPDEIPGNGKDDDNNDYIDDIYGINAIEENNFLVAGQPKDAGDPIDDNGHGTHIAGIIGAVRNNGLEGAGVCPNIKMIAAKAFDITGTADIADVIECIDYIIDLKTKQSRNIVAINASYGSINNITVEKEAIKAVGNAGIVFCASAGNDYIDIDKSPFYPASYAFDNIIAVTAVDHKGNQIYNYGATAVDLGAPGVDILSTSTCYSPQPTDIFFDDMESGKGKWTSGGTNDSWEISKNQEEFKNPDFPVPSPPHFWSDSPDKYYAPNTDAWLMIKQDIDLSDYQEQDVYIGFSAALDIEKRADHAYVEVSGDSGSTWDILMDFSGYNNSWQTGYYFLVPEDVKTENFRLRFRLKSDYTAECPGWLIDDIGVGTTITYGSKMLSGTSMAVPYVTGAVAFLAALYPLDKPAQRIARILDNTSPLQSLQGKCVSGGLLNLDQAAGQPPPITVTSPPGGETFNIGSAITIDCYSWGITGNVEIGLESSDLVNIFTINPGVPYDGFPYGYIVPCSIPAGVYAVKVEKEGTGSGKSGDFTIASAPCITLSAPAGGEIFYTGKQMTIAWDSRDITGDVKISLVRSDLTAAYEISPKDGTTYNNSPYYYTVQSKVIPGCHFIQVEKPDEAVGKSPGFTIRPGVSSITVIKPMAGDTYRRGDTISIEWITSGINGDVVLALKSVSGSDNYIIDNSAPHFSPPVKYRIDENIKTGTYVVEIRQGSIYGLSGKFDIGSSSI